MSANASRWGGSKAVKARRIVAIRMARIRAKGEDVICPRCTKVIETTQVWDVGHTIDIAERPDLIWVSDLHRPEHATCNRADSARKTLAKRMAKSKGLWAW